jgi:glyoxylase-like metal-dependent hydrolase (beta-lactamase superfamily II)
MPTWTTSHRSIDRRTFLGVSGSCAAHMLFMASSAPQSARRFPAGVTRGQLVSQEPWGRLEEVAEGVWALISTPLDGDRTTLCNGGIIAGADGALVVESFATPDGAAWMARQTRQLTGRWPSHVVMTHLHGDHTGGFEGFASENSSLSLMTTETTVGLVRQSDANREQPVSAVRSRMLADVSILGLARPTRIDLGGRSVNLIPRQGHTPSDVTVELEDPSVVFCGDLVWNRMFPNYRDTTPSLFAASVRSLIRDRETIYVPGHGSLSTARDLDLYVRLIDDVGEAAQRAIAAGIPIPEAAGQYELPESFGEWLMFNPRYFEVAFGAWERELKGE